MNKIKFNIYVASMNGSSKSTCDMFESACLKIIGKNKFETRIVDIINDPETAELDRIMAIPTILRKEPAPPRRAIGEIIDEENALKAVQYLINDL